MPKTKGAQQDPAQRALDAAQACRDATREAHEAFQAHREFLREADELHRRMQATLDEIRAYTDERVTRELEHQLAELIPVTNAAIDAAAKKVGAEFDRIEELFLGGRGDGPHLADVAQAYRIAADRATRPIPPCGHQEGLEHTEEFGPDASGLGPTRGEFVVCGICGETSVYDFDVTNKLIMRKPTLTEAKKIKSREVRRTTNQALNQLTKPDAS